jgi:hypothetical protein
MRITMMPKVCTSKNYFQPILPRQSPCRVRRFPRYRPEIASLEERTLLSTLYAVGSGVGDGTSHLYQINDYAAAPKAVDIGSTGTVLTALAIDPQNDAAYGVGGGDLHSVNLTTGKAADIGSLGAPGMNALAFSPNGNLYAMGSTTSDLYTINRTTGHATVVFNTGFTSAGDLAFDNNGDLYLTTSVDLVRISLSDDTATDVGLLGVTNMFGLAIDSSGGIYGAEGKTGASTAILFKINKTTGAAAKIGTIAGSSSLGVYGLSFESTPTPTPAPNPTPTPTPTPRPISPTPTPIPPTPTPNPPTPTPTPPGFTPPPAPPPRPEPGPTANPMPPGSGAFRTQTSVIADPRSAAFGQPIILTATVKNVSAVRAVPDGSVTFLDGTNVLGIANLRGGKASITVGNLPVGQNSIEVVYDGSEFAPSTSSVLIESVHASDPSTRPTRHIKAVGSDTIGSVARGSLLRRHAVRQSMVNTVKPLIPAVKA